MFIKILGFADYFHNTNFAQKSKQFKSTLLTLVNVQLGILNVQTFLFVLEGQRRMI